ncbi:MAG: hypothetical protein ACRC62_19645, partial [Microcoleus sp.]
MEKLAEFQQPCADLFLYLGPNWQTDIPTTEEGEGAIAYWGTLANPGDDDDDDETPDPSNKVYAYVHVDVTYSNGSKRSTSSEGAMELPVGVWAGSGGTVLWADGAVLFSAYIERLGQPPLGISSIAVRTVADGREIPESEGGGNQHGKPPKPPKTGITVKEKRGGQEVAVKTIPRDSKPDNAEFKCESCENNCVLMVRTKSDGTAKGICICKDGLNEEEEKVACEKCKAELLKELPEIITTKIKAELLQQFKQETKEEVKPELAAEIKGSFEGEINNRVPEALPPAQYSERPEGQGSNLVNNVKSALLKDETFLDAIWTAVAAELEKPEFQEELFQSFTGEKIADRIIEISDTDKLKALGAKLIDAIVSVTDEAKLKTLKDKLAAPSNNDPNKLTANGFEWTITKVADKVETVS